MTTVLAILVMLAPFVVLVVLWRLAAGPGNQSPEQDEDEGPDV